MMKSSLKNVERYVQKKNKMKVRVSFYTINI